MLNIFKPYDDLRESSHNSLNQCDNDPRFFLKGGLKPPSNLWYSYGPQKPIVNGETTGFCRWDYTF